MSDDEEVLLAAHPHGRALVAPLALLPVLAGASTFLAEAMPATATGRDLRWVVVGIAVVLAARYCLRPVLRWRATELVVTTERVALTSGLLRRRSLDMPLARVEEVRVDRGLLDRLLRSGTLTVLAGTEGRLQCRNVANPMAVRALLGRARAQIGPPPRR